MLKEDIATWGEGVGEGGRNDRWKKSRAARELSRSRCVEPHPSRPLPPSRISPLSVSRSLPRGPRPALVSSAALLVALTGTHRRVYPFFIIGIDHRLLFYNNRRAAAVALLSAHRRSPFAMPEELTALRRNARRSPVEGGPEIYRDKSPMAGSDVDRAHVLGCTLRLLLRPVPAGCSVAKLRKDCVSLGLSVDRPVDCLAKSGGNFNVTKSVAGTISAYHYVKSSRYGRQ